MSADNKNKCVANGSPATHQTRLRQQEGTGEDSYIHLADWTLSVAAIKKKKMISHSLMDKTGLPKFSTAGES